jgi:hypothetical protein
MVKSKAAGFTRRRACTRCSRGGPVLGKLAVQGFIKQKNLVKVFSPVIPCGYHKKKKKRERTKHFTF